VTRNRRQGLSEEDRQVWKQVTESVKAYPGRSVPLTETDLQKDTVGGEPKPVSSRRTSEHPQALSKPRLKPRPGPIERNDMRRLSRGRLKLEASLDLHGLNQQQAHGLLRQFLESARQRGLRHVLVITGKGTTRGGEGVLQRAVPLWLSQREFSGLVSAFDRAGRTHGGEGALYVRLRKQERDA